MSNEYEQHQFDLFSTLIKWTNAIILAILVVNSLWLWSAFQATVVQNALGLAVMVIGLLCLRMSRRGRIRWAVPIYLSAAMVLVALQIPLTLSQSLTLNGVVWLGALVLVAAYVDSPERAFVWGGVSILLMAVAVTVRLLGPFEALELTPLELSALYLLPALSLLAFAVLGRHAAGRIYQWWMVSESAGRQLRRANQALQQAQAELETANEQLQSQLTERERVEEALRRSLEETARGHSLLLALSQAAQAVQRAHTPEDVYRAIGEGLSRLGHHVAVLRPCDEEAIFEISYVNLSPDQVRELEGIIASPVLGLRFPYPSDSRVQRAWDQGEAILLEQYAGFLSTSLPQPLRPGVTQLVPLLGLEQAVVAPLTVDQRVFGALVVAGSGLTETDRQAVSAFASQAAIALSNVRLYEQTRTWASELERRVEERTAELAASEARYRRLFDSNRDGLFVVDRQGRFLDANPAGCQMLGRGREELLAMDIPQVWAGAEDLETGGRVQFRERMHAVWQQGMPRYETEMICKTGELLPVEITATPLAYQGQEVALGAVRDISGRKRVEVELRRSREEALENHRRLLALSQSAQTVQRAGSAEGVYRAIGEEVAKLGFHALVFTLTPDRSHLVFSHVTFPREAHRLAEKLSGVSTRTARIHLQPDAAMQQVMEQGKTVFFDQTAERIDRIIPGLGPDRIKRLVALLGIDRAIYAPLRIGGELHGLLVVAGRDLKETDVPSVALFANQACIAMENAQLLEEQRTNRSRMQQLAREVVSAQEEERKRLAHALHDEAGQALTALKINLELIAQDVPAGLDGLHGRIAEAAVMANDTMDEIRQLAQDLRPPALDTVGLNPTLSGFCHDFAERTHLSIDYQGLELSPLPEPVDITLYRFLQAALANVARHARARRVRVVLGGDAETISLSVQDDGQGFDWQPGQLAEGRVSGIGLIVMQDRLESLGGWLEVDSQPGCGTRVTAHIPVAEA